MASRYYGRVQDANSRANAARSDGFGDGWLGLGALALALIGIVALSGSGGGARVSPAAVDALRAAIRPAEHSLADVEAAFDSLCEEPLLIGLELAPDCETGVMTLPDAFFDGRTNPRIRPEAREYIAAAMTTWLNRLRELPALWDSLEAIEIRGHAAPASARERYASRAVVSQQRALATLAFLTGQGGIDDEGDRRDLERLALVSGSADARPPANCPESTPACLPHWRRVEIRPVLSEALRRGDWARTIESVRVSTAGLVPADSDG